MAERIRYDTTATTARTAHEDLEQLLEVLHRTGTLEVLSAFVGQLAAIGELVVDQLTTEAGRNLSRNLSLFGVALAKLPPEEVESIVNGAADGMRAAHSRASERPPGTLRLMAALRNEDVRRGADTLLAIVAGIGGRMRSAGSAAADDAK
jgi:uncharacterized protein YjgD (DUF1641 family)